MVSSSYRTLVANDERIYVSKFKGPVQSKGVSLFYFPDVSLRRVRYRVCRASKALLDATFTICIFRGWCWLSSAVSEWKRRVQTYHLYLTRWQRSWQVPREPGSNYHYFFFKLVPVLILPFFLYILIIFYQDDNQFFSFASVQTYGTLVASPNKSFRARMVIMGWASTNFTSDAANKSSVSTYNDLLNFIGFRGGGVERGGGSIGLYRMDITAAGTSSRNNKFKYSEFSRYTAQ